MIAKFDVFFDHASVSFNQCPGKHWRFRFVDGVSGKAYFNYLNSLPLNKRHRFRASTIVESVSGDTVIFSSVEF